MKELSRDELAKITGGMSLFQGIIAVAMYVISAVKAYGQPTPSASDSMQYGGGELDLPRSKSGIALV